MSTLVLSLFGSDSKTSRMLASSIFGLKTDMESIDVPADGKKAAYAGEFGQYRTRGTE